MESEKKGSAASNIVLISLITAVGVTATAYVIVKKLRGKSVRLHLDDLVGACDRAAQALDDRLHTEYATA